GRQIYVGGPASSGGNSLSITNGALVQANLSGETETQNIDALALGFESSWSQDLGQDQVTVDGEGSTLDAHGTIVVGINGVAELDVTNGATLIGYSYSSTAPNGGGVSGAGQNQGSIGTI